MPEFIDRKGASVFVANYRRSREVQSSRIRHERIRTDQFRPRLRAQARLRIQVSLMTRRDVTAGMGFKDVIYDDDVVLPPGPWTRWNVSQPSRSKSWAGRARSQPRSALSWCWRC